MSYTSAMARAFVYSRRRSAVHSLDPRCRLITALLLIAFSVASPSTAVVTASYAIALALAGVAHVLSPLIRLQALTIAIAAIIAAADVLGGYSALFAITMGLRFASIASAASLFFLTTPPEEVGDVLSWMHLPRDLVFAFSTAVRLVPVVMLDISMISDAQRARGLGARRGLRGRLAGSASLLIPAVLTSLERGREIAEAMAIRGYGKAREPRMARRDWVCVVSISAMAAAMIYLSFINAW